MGRTPLRPGPTGISAVLIAMFFGALPVSAQNWPEFYDPLQVRTLNLTLSSQDWNTILHDQTNTIVVPAQLSLPSETPILVGLRRKSSRGLPSESSPQKVGLKIDINEYVEQSWHGIKKLSLENGADTSLLLEGFAWFLHVLAWNQGVYPYRPGLASWIRLYVNGVYNGCFVNAEQVDKRFLENRGVWLSDDSWLYKASDVGSHTIEFGGPEHSPTYNTLCYSPFPVGSCSTPSIPTLAIQLGELIDMQGMLTLGAVNAWSYSPDNLFSKGKNHFYADYRYSRRLYFTWDMDASFGSLNTSRSIYELGGSAYEDVILDHPTFRRQYDNIMRTLLDDSFSTANLTAQLNSLETVLLPALSSDPYNPVSAGDFADLRNYIAARNISVASQLPATVAVDQGEAPAGLSASPNPFQARTDIQFQVHRAGQVLARVYDARGASVRTLVDGMLPVGRHHATWDGADDHGRRLGAGMYFLQVITAAGSWSRRVALLR